MQDADAGEILRHFHAHKKPTALLCHGPIVVAAKDVVWAKLEALRDGAAIASRRLWR
jgi:putative intracellular protease/amidase